MKSLCIIDDDPEVRDTILTLAHRMRLSAATAGNLGEGIDRLARERFDVVLLDVRLPDGSGLMALPDIKRLPEAPEVILLTGLDDPDGAELVLREGVWDYLVKPSSIREIRLTLERALRYREEKQRDRAPVSLNLADCVAVSPRMRPCLDQVAHAAWSNAAVLITGEAGTGKELFARLIHANSARAKGPFVAVDCAAVTETVMESTLFGHERGASAATDADRPGLVRQAHGGTLFLDGVANMPLALQATFLRVLHEKRFRPVGAASEATSDCRLIAATDRDLESLIERGLFRSDLFFRLKTIALPLPPLRERPEDIKPLTLAFTERLCAARRLPPKGFDGPFLALLRTYDWPGNVRELRDVLEAAVTAADREPTLVPRHLPREVRFTVTRSHLDRDYRDVSPVRVDPETPLTAQSLKDFKEAMEQRYLTALIRGEGRDVSAMLARSGLSRSHFYALLKKYGLSLPD